MKPIQSPSVVSDRGRQGRVESADNRLNLELGAEGPTPEHLFAAAYAACLHSALLAVAERSHLRIDGSTVTVRVRLEETDHGQHQLSAEVKASIPGAGKNDAEHLLHQAHEACPYSRMSRHGISVKLGTD